MPPEGILHGLLRRLITSNLDADNNGACEPSNEHCEVRWATLETPVPGGPD